MDKWEDTVMKPKEYSLIIEQYTAYPRSPSPSGRSELAENLIARQAKTTWPIAFKAGKEEGKQEGIEKGKRIAVEFIESYLVTTVHPEGDMHHIDDKEWQLVKLKLLRQAFLKERGK